MCQAAIRILLYSDQTVCSDCGRYTMLRAGGFDTRGCEMKAVIRHCQEKKRGVTHCVQVAALQWTPAEKDAANSSGH
jgi:hypothetical protein